LRIELSDYLIERMGDLWMLDIMVACQELDEEDVRLYRSGGAALILAAPTAPAPAVEDLAVTTSAVADLALVAPDEETFAAMRWASTLDDEASVLHLIRTLPKQIVEEQVCLYRGRDEATLAAAALKKGPKLKISLGPKALLQTRLLVAQRFHKYCEKNAINTDQRMPYGAMSTFIADNIAWKAKQKKLSAKTIREWYTAWRRSSGHVGGCCSRRQRRTSARAQTAEPPQEQSTSSTFCQAKSLWRWSACQGNSCSRRALRMVYWHPLSYRLEAVDCREPQSRGKALGSISSFSLEAQSVSVPPRL
jgi:hypothetical protein